MASPNNRDPTFDARFSIRGSFEMCNWRVCWQAHDDYYDCIKKQTSDGTTESEYMNINDYDYVRC